MSWKDALQEVVRRYYRAGASDPPEWVTSATGDVPTPVTVTNATCGDRVVVHLERVGASAGHTGRIWLDVAGCAICKASAEMAVRAAESLSRGELERLAREMLSNIGESSDSDDDTATPFRAPVGSVPPEDIETILRLRTVPGRRRCASLPWEAVLAALGSSR
jgi:NifU-like protein involved in Fe-S cluster formation